MATLRGLAQTEHTEPPAGHFEYAPRTGRVGLPRRGGLVALADAMEEGRGKRVTGRRKDRIAEARHGD